MARPSVEAERREQILDAACAVIGERGITAMRVSDVAERAGLSTGSVHYYFETKQALTHAAFEWNYTRSLERRRAILARRAPARQRLRALVTSYLPHGARTRAAWQVWAETWVEAMHDPDLRRLNDEVYGSWRSMVAELIREGQAEGEIVAGDPVLLATTVVSTIDGLAIQSLIGSRHMTQRWMRAACDHLLDTITAPTSGTPSRPR